MLGLIPIALTIVPQLARWLIGDKAGQTATAVVQAVQAATGTSDPAAAQAQLVADPGARAQLLVQLAQIAAEREAAAQTEAQAQLVATLNDVASARAQTVALAQAHSPIAWGAPVVSTVVLLTFGGMLGSVLSRAVPPGSEALANIMLGTLAGMATSVVSYWVGSSAGSARKTEELATARDQLANSAPVAGSKL